MPMLAGMPVTEVLVHELASRLRDVGDVHLAATLETALSHGRPVSASRSGTANTSCASSRIALTGSPTSEPSGSKEHTWRQSEGL